MFLVGGGSIVGCQRSAGEVDGTQKQTLERGADERQTEVLGLLYAMHGQEIERSELARRQATIEEVRLYADRVMRDHRHARERLMLLARRVDAPVLLAAKRAGGDVLKWRFAVETSARGEGIELDRAYLMSTVDAHDRSISRMIEAQTFVDQEVASHIATVLPIMIQHRAFAFSLLARLPAS